MVLVVWWWCGEGGGVEDGLQVEVAEGGGSGSLSDFSLSRVGNND